MMMEDIVKSPIRTRIDLTVSPFDSPARVVTSNSLRPTPFRKIDLDLIPIVDKKKEDDQDKENNSENSKNGVKKFQKSLEKVIGVEVKTKSQNEKTTASKNDSLSSSSSKSTASSKINSVELKISSSSTDQKQINSQNVELNFKQPQTETIMKSAFHLVTETSRVTPSQSAQQQSFIQVPKKLPQIVPTSVEQNSTTSSSKPQASISVPPQATQQRKPSSVQQTSQEVSQQVPQPITKTQDTSSSTLSSVHTISKPASSMPKTTAPVKPVLTVAPLPVITKPAPRQVYFPLLLFFFLKKILTKKYIRLFN